MWVLEATFEDATAPYRKFLKPGGVYNFGRKPPAELVLVDKTVSKESATIYVDPYEPGKEHRPPELTILALKRVIRIIDQKHREEWERDRERFIGEDVSPNSRRKLKSGDVIILTRSAPSVKVLWMPILLGVSTKIANEAIKQQKQDCQILGIGMERSKQFLPNATHFILPTSAAFTATIMQALMAAAHLVTMNYLDEVIRRAKLTPDDEEESLESRLSLPDAKAYFPEDIEVEGMTRSQIEQVLASNERRKTIFVGTTFLFVQGEAGMSKTFETAMALCKAGRGRVVVENAGKFIDDDSILRLLRRNLSEAQSLLAECGEAASEAPDEGLVVVCHNDDTDKDWHSKLIHLTKQMKISMPMLGPAAIHQAILHADPRRFLNQMAGDSKNEIMPHSTNYETLPPTAPPPQRKTAEGPPATPFMDLDEAIQPSAASREPTPSIATLPPTSIAASDNQKSPRKPKRRADMIRRDPLEDIFGTSIASSSTIETNGVSATGEAGAPPSQASRSTARPRRYDGTDNKRPRASETWRSIFDTSTNETQGTDLGSTYGDASQSKTRKYRQELDEADRLATQRASVHQEEEGISQAASQVGDTTEMPVRKRRAHSPIVGESQPARQRQRQSQDFEQDRDGLEFSSKPATTTASLANTLLQGDKEAANTDKTGNSDTDSKFLQAIATSKRSKKGLDDFDKEFNQLRLARPAHATGNHGKIIADADDPEYRAWQQMGASDFDINAAGNFVQVDFVPLVYRRSEEEEQERSRMQLEMQEKWGGKPNFKKFRSKERIQKKPVALDVNEGNDYGLGDGYTGVPKASARAATQRIASFSDEDEEDVREAESNPNGKKNGYQEDLSSNDEDTFMQSTAPSKFSTQQSISTQRKQRTKTTSPGKERQEISTQRKRALDVRLDIDLDLDDSLFPSRSRATPSVSKLATNSKTKREALELSSDEDDEDRGFSGFRKKRKS